MIDDNPYRSPQSPSLEFARRPGLQVTLASSRWLYRCLRVEAPVEAVIEYRGRGVRERVEVNGTTLRQYVTAMWFAPLFAFDLPTNQEPLHVEVHVRVNLLLRIRGFQLWLDGRLAYEEGQI